MFSKSACLVLGTLFSLSVASQDEVSFSHRELVVCNSTIPTTEVAFDFYVAVGYLEESIPAEVSDSVSQTMVGAVDVCPADSAIAVKSDLGNRRLAAGTVTLADVMTTDYLCPFGLRPVIQRTGTLACDVLKVSTAVEVADEDTIESVAEAIREDLKDQTNFATVFASYDFPVSFLDYLGDSVSGEFPQEDAPLKSDNEGQIVAAKGQGSSVDSSTALGLGLGLGLGIPLVVGGVVYARSRRGASS